MRVAVSSDGHSLKEWRIEAMPQTFDAGIARLRQCADSLCGGEKIRAVCGGFAGPFDRGRTALLSGEHISDWVGKPIKSELEKLFDAPVYLENDAALAGLGEAIFGAGKGEEIVAYLTISTGVGGARITKGKIDASAMGFEPGYQIIDAGRCFFPERDARRLRRYISGTALGEHYGKPAQEIKDPAAWERVAELLAIGLQNTIVYWSPDIIVLGGAVMQSISLEAVRWHLKAGLKRFLEPPPVVGAALGDLSGIWGGLVRLQQE